MKKLSKLQLKARDELSAKLRTAREEAEGVINDANAKMREAQDAYDAVLKEAEEWRDAIVSAMESYAGDRSEKWTESDAGSAYEEWKSSFESMDFDINHTIEEVDVDDVLPDVADELDGLEESPSS